MKKGPSCSHDLRSIQEIGAGISGPKPVADPDAEHVTRAYGRHMVGIPAVTLHAVPDRVASDRLDSVIRFLVDKPLAILGILVEDQFGVGDWVDLSEATGSVEAITLRATRIRSVDGTVWHVPNGQIQRAGNMSEHWSRVLLDVQIALDSGIDRARDAMKRVADEVWHEDRAIIEEPEVCGVQRFGPGGITIRLVAKTRPLEQWRISRLLRERIKGELDREGIEVRPPTPWNAVGQPAGVASQPVPR